jgi:DNA-binding NtrC family response regulator
MNSEGWETRVKRGRIVLLDDDRAAVRATRRRLAALDHTLLAVIERPANAVAAVETHAPDLLIVNARSVGERVALRIARQVVQRFATPCLLLSTTPQIKPTRATRSTATIVRVRGVQELDNALQIALLRQEVEHEQKHAEALSARADRAEGAIRSTARLVHQLNNLLSAIRCNAFLMQSEADQTSNLSEAARDITIAVERGAHIMTELTGLVRESGPLEPPFALPVPIPRDGSSYPALQTKGRDARATALGRTVLVVDDDQVVHRALTRFLTSRGYRILAARTPAEAIFIAKHEQIAVVITDVIMPEMTGYDLAARIEQMRPGLRVIYMSGYAPSGFTAPGGAVRGSPAPMLQKPFDVEVLVHMLSAALEETEREASAEHVPARIVASNDP